MGRLNASQVALPKKKAQASVELHGAPPLRQRHAATRRGGSGAALWRLRGGDDASVMRRRRRMAASGSAAIERWRYGGDSPYNTQPLENEVGKSSKFNCDAKDFLPQRLCLVGSTEIGFYNTQRFYNTQPLVQRLCVVGSTKIGFYNTQLLESSFH